MPDRPRVLMVSGEAPPLVGGVGDCTAPLVDALAAARPGWRWSWLSRRPRALGAPVGRRGPVRMLRPAHRWDGPWASAAALAARLARPSLVHIQEELYSFFETDAPGRVARALRGVPLVLTVHEYHLDHPLAARTAELVRRADVVLANDRRMAERCARAAGRAPDRVLWSLNTVPPADPAWGVRPVPGRVTTFGFLNRLKGLEPLYRALRDLRGRHPGLHWKIIGPFHPGSNPDHAALARELAGDWVEFVGGLPARDRRLRVALAESSLMALPFADGASLRRTTLQAAWAAGLPVVTTPPDPPEPAILDGENCLLARDLTPAALAEPIARVLGDPALAARLRAGSLAAAERFSAARQAEAHLEIYEALLG
jgi:glycosyltransferase involved in cell wall biosynthesis